MQTHKNKSIQITNSIVILPTRLGIILIIIITSFLGQNQTVHAKPISIDSADNLELKSSKRLNYLKTSVLLSNEPAFNAASSSVISSPSHLSHLSRVGLSNAADVEAPSIFNESNPDAVAAIVAASSSSNFLYLPIISNNELAEVQDAPTATSAAPTPTATRVAPTPTSTRIPPTLTQTATFTPTKTSTNTPVSTPGSGNFYYVDNAATGANNGTSWTDAWKSFAAITWSSIKAGSTLYISGGSSSQTYNEILNIGASGSAGNFITIDVGANSPAPSGHSGTVIINGGGVREKGIWINNRSYIRINGYDRNNIYRLQVQNVLGLNVGDPCIYVEYSHYVYVDYVKVIANTSRGIFFNTCTNCRLRGSDSETGVIDLAVQTDPLFISQGTDNIVENNILIQGNRDSALLHIDPIITNQETRLIIRNNWIEALPGLVDLNENAFLIENIHDRLDFYNNVVIGSNVDQEKVGMFKQTAEAAALYYITNNTFITKNAAGGVLEFFNWTNDQLGALKNNIFYSPNGELVLTDFASVFSPASKINNNDLYRASGSPVFYFNGGDKTWAQWQSYGYDAHGINQNPQFVDPANKNYHLLAGSPACTASDTGGYVGAYPCQ